MSAASSMGRRILFGVLFGVIVYAGILTWLDAGSVLRALRAVPLWVVAAAMGLSFLNYLIRFLKWERYRKLLDIELDRPTSFLIYLSGLCMSITPGKMGEVFKSWLIRKVKGVRIHRSAPIVVAERFTDLLGYLILVAIGGIFSYPEYRNYFWLALGLCVVAQALAGSHRFAAFTTAMLKRAPLLWRISHKAEGAFESTRILLAPRQVVVPTLQSVVSWGCECTGFWLIANSMTEAELPFIFAVFAYALSAVAGAVLIVFPGGIGPTEGLLGMLLRRRYQELTGVTIDVARSQAGGAVILARFCTLWFAVLVGMTAVLLFQRRYGEVDELESEPE